MANTLTDLIPDLYAAVDVVSREQVGFIPAVTLGAGAERAAVNQTVRVPISPAATAYDITPGVTVPDQGNQTVSNTTITITKSKAAPVRWNGEEVKGLGFEFLSFRAQQFAQAMRTLANEIEADLAALYTSASRAYGTAGTTPFGTANDFSDAAQALKILLDNGAGGDLNLVINTAAGASIRGKQSQVYAQGSDSLLRQGVLLDIHGFAIRESAKVKAHTKGTGASYLVNNASNYAAGSTTLALDTGTGTVLAGDILTNSESGRDANKYVVGTALSAGSLAINKPGLINGWNDGDAVAVGNSYAANMAFSRSAIVLATRPPEVIGDQDAASDSMMVTDPRSGLTFEIREYRTYRQTMWEVAIAWGVAAIKPEHMAILLG